MAPPPKSSSRGEKVPHGFLSRTIYKNTLPEIPFEPKFLEYKFEEDRFTSYNTTSLERQHKIELHVPRNLGIHIELIDPRAYKPKDKNKRDLHPDDEKLIEDEKSKIDKTRSLIHNEATNIFRRSEIIASKNRHYGKVGLDIVERKLGAGRQSQQKHATGARKEAMMRQNKQLEYKTREEQIETIEKGFQAVKDQTKYHNHPQKKGVHAVEYLPIFPDFETWQHPCCQVVFDTDPAQGGIGQTQEDRLANDEELSQAMIRGMVDEDGDQFVAYFMPTQQTLEKRNMDAQACVPYDENGTYDYKLTKEYNWLVKNNKQPGTSMQNYEQNYFFAWRDGQVFYNELDTKVRLTKRKKEIETNTGKKMVKKPVPTTKAILAVKHRPLNEQEITQQNQRSNMLNNDDEESDSSSGEDSSSDDDDDEVRPTGESTTVKPENSENSQSTKVKKENQEKEAATPQTKADTDSGSNNSSSDTEEEEEEEEVEEAENTGAGNKSPDSDSSDASDDPFGAESDNETAVITNSQTQPKREKKEEPEDSNTSESDSE